MSTLSAADQTRVGLIMGFAALLGSPSMRAQMPQTPAVADIPFAFQVGYRSMSAGTYIVEVKGKDVFSIKGNSGMTATVVKWASTKRTSPDGAIIFHREGSDYVLREVRAAGNQGYLWSGETMEELRVKLKEDAASSDSGPREDKVEIALLAPRR